ncbi:hypothetical protein J6590_092635, partial [Homalodisca vitripennis]
METYLQAEVVALQYFCSDMLNLENFLVKVWNFVITNDKEVDNEPSDIYPSYFLTT